MLLELQFKHTLSRSLIMFYHSVRIFPYILFFSVSNCGAARIRVPTRVISTPSTPLGKLCSMRQDVPQDRELAAEQSICHRNSPPLPSSALQM